MSEPRHGPPPGEVPNEEEAAQAFPHVRTTRPLREQVDLTDEQGEDIRRYTGEPVETDEGIVVPQQMVVGSQRVVGGGEFPDNEARGLTDRGDGADHADRGEAPPDDPEARGVGTSDGEDG